MTSTQCSECEDAPVEVQCSDCRDVFCDPCFRKCHAKGNRLQHLSHRVGENSRPILDVVNEEIALARQAFEGAVRAVRDIRDAGYPELSCPGLDRQPKPASMLGVPVIPASELQLLQQTLGAGELIGEGAFAQVYRIEVPNAGLVAFKRFMSGANVELMKREADAIFKVRCWEFRGGRKDVDKCANQLRHPNVVHLLGVCLDPGFTGLVLELVDGGSLSSLIYTSPQPTCFDKNSALGVLRSICVGLDFVHSQHHLPLDVKVKSLLFLHVCTRGGRTKSCVFAHRIVAHAGVEHLGVARLVCGQTVGLWLFARTARDTGVSDQGDKLEKPPVKRSTNTTHHSLCCEHDDCCCRNKRFLGCRVERACALLGGERLTDFSLEHAKGSRAYPALGVAGATARRSQADRGR